MSKYKILFINYKDDHLFEELRSLGYEVSFSRGDFEGEILGRYDIVYFCKFVPPTFDDLRLFSSKVKVPLIYGWHFEYLPVVFKLNRPSNYVQAFIAIVKVLVLKLKNFAVHVLNYDQYKAFVKLGLNVTYIPLGVNTGYFRPQKKYGEFTVIFVSPRYQKGVDFLVKIIPQVIRREPEVKFVLTGRGFLGSKYYRVLKEYYPRNVEVLENLPQKEFLNILSRSHVLLFSSRRETFGRIVLEALACELPIVAFDIPGAARDIVKRYSCGVIAKPFNWRKICAGLLHLYRLWRREPLKFRQLQEYCRQVAKKYDWKILAKLYDKLFRNMIHDIA